MDRISELPEDIIHHIYSFLPTNDVVKTSLLSILWHSNFLSYPILNLDRSLFISRSPSSTELTFKDTEFLDYVDNSLQRMFKQNLNIKKLRLNMSYDSPTTSLVDELVALTIHQSVKEVLGFCRNIRVLELCNYVLGWCLPEEGVALPCLDKLCLKQVELDESKLEELLDGCPSVSYFSYDECNGLENLSISGLKKLKTLEVALPETRIDINVVIDSPVLESLSIKGDSCANVELVSGQNLKRVAFGFARFCGDEFLKNLLPKFPNIESLSLDHLDDLHMLKISSHHLKDLRITGCRDLKRCEIDGPNLDNFMFKGYFRRNVCIVSTARRGWLIKLDLPNELHNLKQFLEGKKIKYLTLSIGQQVEQLNLVLSYSQSGSYYKIIDGLLSMCQPKNLYVEWNGESIEFIKVICANLMGNSKLKNWNIERMKEKPCLNQFEEEVIERPVDMDRVFGAVSLTVEKTSYFSVSWIAEKQQLRVLKSKGVDDAESLDAAS